MEENELTTPKSLLEKEFDISGINDREIVKQMKWFPASPASAIRQQVFQEIPNSARLRYDVGHCLPSSAMVRSTVYCSRSCMAEFVIINFRQL
jgi:hypothetical protein